MNYFSESGMRIFKYISIFFCLVLVFSCTKPEDDTPHNQVPPTVTDKAFRDFEPEQGKPDRPTANGPAPVFINDDGDDESGPSRVVHRLN